MHPLKISMIITFILTMAVLFMGITNMARGKDSNGLRSRISNHLMLARVALSFALLVQIVIYVTYFRQ